MILFHSYEIPKPDFFSYIYEWKNIMKKYLNEIEMLISTKTTEYFRPQAFFLICFQKCLKSAQYLARESLGINGWIVGKQNIYRFTHLCLLFIVPKMPFDDIFFYQSTFQKIFQGEMLIKIQHTNLLKIFCEFLINSKNVFQRCHR